MSDLNKEMQKAIEVLNRIEYGVIDNDVYRLEACFHTGGLSIDVIDKATGKKIKMDLTGFVTDPLPSLRVNKKKSSKRRKAEVTKKIGF